MPRYLVKERQTIIVAYYVEADSEDMARDLVEAMGSDEYDDVIEAVEVSTIGVEELGEDA